MTQRLVARGIERIFAPAIRAGWRANRLSGRYEKLSTERRVAILADIERDLQEAHTLARAALILARHDHARQS